MKLKTITAVLLFASTLLTACSTNDETQDLKLSVNDEIVYTDATDYSFDIISGTGKYQVAVDPSAPNQPLAKVILKGNHVQVELLSYAAGVTVKDQNGQSIHLSIYSSNSSLQMITYLVGVHYGEIMKTPVNFGAGGYSIVSQSGDAAQVTNINEKGIFTIKSVHPGEIHLLITDKRGTTRGMTIDVGEGYDLTSDELTITAKGDLYITFPLKYGDGKWKIISSPIESPSLVIMEQGELFEQDMLQVPILKDSKTPMVFKLKDKSNHIATITINVQ